MSEKFEKFTHGIIAITPEKPNADGSIPVMHFVGYWEKPQEADILGLHEELSNDEELGLTEMMDDIELIPATPEVLEHFNSLNYHDHD